MKSLTYVFLHEKFDAPNHIIAARLGVSVRSVLSYRRAMGFGPWKRGGWRNGAGRKKRELT